MKINTLTDADAQNVIFVSKREATQADTDSLIEGVAPTEDYLETAVFDRVEFHGAQDYVIAQFSSSYTNKRMAAL